jgi:8-amino-7-oxononanoate synthase
VSYLRRVNATLDDIRAHDRYRAIERHHPDGVVDFASNDYLGLAAEPQVVEALRRAKRVGSGGARLLSGRDREHSLLEEELAQWLGRERALLFSSGYLAALGATTVLASVTGSILSDERNHASLIDGIRLSHAPRTIYPHGVLPDRNGAPPALVVTESVFGMDGDALDPRDLLAALREEDALLVDEAHALGIAGAQGAGLARPLDDPRVVVLGTLSKALGTLGGFVAGPAPLIDLLVNRARSFIFDTALPPAIALAARIALLLARKADDRRRRVFDNVDRLRAGLSDLGFPVTQAPSAIVPLVLGSEERARGVAGALAERKIYAPAIRPPTVPAGTSRLRFCVRADHTAEQIDLLLKQLRRCIGS